MKGYAHPIEGTDEWCNEPESPQPGPTPGQRADMQTEVDNKKPGNLAASADTTAETLPNAPQSSQVPNLTGQRSKQVETVVPPPTESENSIDMDCAQWRAG